MGLLRVDPSREAARDKLRDNNDIASRPRLVGRQMYAATATLLGLCELYGIAKLRPPRVGRIRNAPTMREMHRRKCIFQALLREFHMEDGRAEEGDMGATPAPMTREARVALPGAHHRG